MPENRPHLEPFMTSALSAHLMLMSILLVAAPVVGLRALSAADAVDVAKARHAWT